MNLKTMTMTMNSRTMTMNLEQLRCEIDRIDEELVRLLNERARHAVQIGKEKQKHGSPVRNPDREDQVLERAATLNSGPLARSTIKSIFRTIISACTNLQKTPK